MESLKNDKILILSSNYGDGHFQAAQAIYEAIKLTKPVTEAVVFDFMKWTHPHIHSMSRFIFIQGIKKLPSLYGYLYQKTHDANTFSLLLKKLNCLGVARMLKLLQDVQPSVVVSIFPLAAGTMSVLKSNGLTKARTVTIITDHCDHSYWIYPYTDQYIVGSDLVRQGLLRLNMADSQIAVTGIPIRPKFCKSYHRNILMEKYDLSPALPTVLFMSGGCGIMDGGVSMIQALNALPQSIQLIIVCGHNKKLKHQLVEESKSSKHLMLITGYIDYVHEFMAVSDLMITKPGGLTTSEAIARELPLLLYGALPGQEQDNTRYLTQAGVAMTARDCRDLAEKLSYVLNHPHFLSIMRDNAKKLQKKWSAFDALEMILCNDANPNNLKEKASTSIALTVT